jgi:hypothetical protein
MGFTQTGCAMEQINFFDISLPTYASSECSPDLPGDFTGLRIAMPAEVDLSTQNTIPMCGAYRVSSKFIEMVQAKLIEHTVIVFTNKENNQSFSFSLVPDKEPLEIEEPHETDPFSEDAEILQDYKVNMFFNIDVLSFYPDFPRNKASYTVFATIRDIKSDVIETVVVN